ncbi:unnamed protein product [Paramecium octaurelia]|uniref:Uncharacterized protein n=1 Tax=Paramecium octaurelia TaxID=43137 RepID=A0A8S1TPX4_PAROT|nr:unnamed protein product [Paramecium octaurelia]
MSLGVDFEQYQFDRRLKELQDRVFTLNHRAPQGYNFQGMPPREPQHLNNQIFYNPSGYPLQQPQTFVPYMQNFNPYQQQYMLDEKSLQKKKEEKEEKERKKNEQRQLELKQLEEQLIKKQELMISNMKKDILDYIDPYIYGQYHNYYNYSQQQQNYLQQQNQNFPIQHQNQVPIYSQSPPPINIQPSQYMQQYQNPYVAQNLNGIPQQINNSQFSKVGQQSMQKIDNLLTGI